MTDPEFGNKQWRLRDSINASGFPAGFSRKNPRRGNKTQTTRFISSSIMSASLIVVEILFFGSFSCMGIEKWDPRVFVKLSSISFKWKCRVRLSLCRWKKSLIYCRYNFRMIVRYMKIFSAWNVVEVFANSQKNVGTMDWTVSDSTKNIKSFHNILVFDSWIIEN